MIDRISDIVSRLIESVKVERKRSRRDPKRKNICRPGDECLPCRTDAYFDDVFFDPTAGLWVHDGCSGRLRKAGRDSAKCQFCGKMFDPPEVLPY